MIEQMRKTHRHLNWELLRVSTEYGAWPNKPRHHADRALFYPVLQVTIVSEGEDGQSDGEAVPYTPS